MTVATGGGGALSAYGDFTDDIGLEDVNVSDMSIPRLRIVHAEGEFEDNLSGFRTKSLRCILLGLVKQRIMWHKEVDDDDLPMCKSPDHEHGFPLTVSDKQPKDKFFPWPKSNFNPADYPPENGINGLTTLPCASCVFSQWDKGDWKQPPCSEQHTFPLFYTPDDGETWQPGLLTLQKTGMKPSKQYISSFASARRPLFTSETVITLDVIKRGQVIYSVPKLVRGQESNRDNWPEYGQSYLRVRELIRSAPRPLDSDDADAGESAPASANENTPPPAATTAPPAATAPPVVAPPAAAAPAAPVAPSAPSAPADDSDDMPF